MGLNKISYIVFFFGKYVAKKVDHKYLHGSHITKS